MNILKQAEELVFTFAAHAIFDPEKTAPIVNNGPVFSESNLACSASAKSQFCNLFGYNSLFVFLSSWSGYFLLGWILFALYVIVKKDWFKLSEPFGPFPFSLKQLAFAVFQLFCAFSLFIFSLYLAHSFVSRFPPLRAFGFQERFAAEQLIGLLLTASGLFFFTSFLPPESRSITMGQQNGWKHLWRGALYGLFFYPLISSITWIVSCAVSWITQEPPTPQAVLTFLSHFDHSSILFWMLCLSIVVFVPYVEEVLFRGFLQGFLGGVFHPLLAILGTSIIFSFFHYSPLQKSSNFEIMFGLFVFSLFVSRLRVREDSVISCVGMHAAFNAISLTLASI